ncbi:MAG: LPS assembly lipoprotein LptE [Planctomycetota bacterium]
MPAGPRQPGSPRVVAVATALCAAAAAGCAGYRVGAESLYAPDVQTVYVPMIESDSFRRDLGERLTELVVKEIELKTPFKVVGSPTADSVLTIRVAEDRRRTLAEDPFDQPRVLENEVVAEVAWLNRRRLPIAPVQVVPIPAGVTPFRQDSMLVPAAGQSVAQAQQDALHRLAQQIVGAMEEPW